MMNSADAWTQIAASPFVSLGTFRKSGELVATPVWVALDGQDLVVTTERGSGKVKRLRRNSRVTLRPCGRMGKVESDAVTVTAFARTEADGGMANSALAAKYGFQFRAVLGFERLVRSLQRKPGQRVILRISQAVPE